MNILVTLNSNYLKPLRVMLKSLFLNNREEKFSIYLMHSALTTEELGELNSYIDNHDSRLTAINIEDDYFADAPVLYHYTKEMYYRLLAHKFLPEDLDRILYLDPDILIINPIKELYYMDIEEYLYAAAYHDIISVKEINKLRLKPYDIDAYYNSGVLLMNLKLHRQLIDEKGIFEFVEKNHYKLIMPDQDILNALYAKKIKSIDEKLYNYDVRYFRYYKVMSNNLWDMDYVINNTVVLHFCGKKKPWKKDYNGKFHSLYKHYEKLAFTQ
jgi:lipopolysaccharide biosynthesis glycosyltransferase